MARLNYAYYVFIRPIELLLSFLFDAAVGLVGLHSLALIILSILVTLMMLPLNYLAEKIQAKERAVQQAMKPKLDEYKSVFKGYELHLYTVNLYKQYNYNPIYSLRSILGLLIQLPFFVAAYNVLSGYNGFQGVSLGFISDLSKPDSVAAIGNLQINLLPFIMIILNLVSGWVYTKSFSLKRNLSLYVVALVFFVLLYSAPSALLLYWSLNNFFSIFKNLAVSKLAIK